MASFDDYPEGFYGPPEWDHVDAQCSSQKAIVRARFSDFVERLNKGEFIRAEELYHPLKASYGVMIPQTIVSHIADLLVGNAQPPRGKPPVSVEEKILATIDMVMFSQIAKEEIEEARAKGRLVRDFNDDEITEDDPRWDRSVYQMSMRMTAYHTLGDLETKEPGDPDKWEQVANKVSRCRKLARENNIKLHY